MASIILSAVGYWAGGAIGGSFLGISAVTIGSTIGGLVGSAIDAKLFAPDKPVQRLDDLRVTSSTEGAVIPFICGRFRTGGNIIWATDFEEYRASGAYKYRANLAVGICEGPVSGLGRIWADGDLLDTSDVTYRFYRGDETQLPDALMEAKMGVGEVPAYRGLAYIVFEGLELEDFGNRIPQLSFEIFQTSGAPGDLENMIRAAHITGGGEFTLATDEIRSGVDGDTETLNMFASPAQTDFVTSLDRLAAVAPNVEQVVLTPHWFGIDLRAAACAIYPRAESADQRCVPDDAWMVGLVGRAAGAIYPPVDHTPADFVVSQTLDGDRAFGGTPSDFAVLQAIVEADARGLKCALRPTIMLDIPQANSLPTPYSDLAAAVGQPSYPPASEVTCSPARDYQGDVDGTAAAAAQIAAFFGSLTAADFVVESSGTGVGETLIYPWPEPDEWSYRRIVLHYAHLAAVSGLVSAFVLPGVPGLTNIRDDAGNFPAVAELRALVAEVRSILGPNVEISYASVWSEYGAFVAANGDIRFPLDALWSDANIDFVAIDYDVPLSDWRDGVDHLDAQIAPSVYDKDYLKGGVEGGEFYDWTYADSAARAAQTRSAITDPLAVGKEWIYRPKDLRGWWSSSHYERTAGVEAGASTAWVPESKRIALTVACCAVDRGANQPSAQYDPKASASTAPYNSRGWRDDAMQRRYLEAVLGYWSDLAHNPTSSQYAAPMIDLSASSVAGWDARPHPDYPGRTDIWPDAPLWFTGSALGGRLGAAPLASVVAAICERAGLSAGIADTSELYQVVTGLAITALESGRSSLTPLLNFFQLDAVESGDIVKFRPRQRLRDMVIDIDDLVASRDQGDVIELTRAQSTELPSTLKWNVVNAEDGAYDPAPVEAMRLTVSGGGLTAQTFAFAVPLEDADRLCQSALYATWAAIESLAGVLPQRLLALEPSDIIGLVHDGRTVEYRVSSVADAGSRPFTAVRHDPAVYDLPPGARRSARLSGSLTYGAPTVQFMDLPQIKETDQPFAPYISVYARPWYGQAALWRSLSSEDFVLLDTIAAPSNVGVLIEDLSAGPLWRWDRSSAAVVKMQAGTPTSISDDAVRAGGNMLAVEVGAGAWEVLQFATAELIGAGQYRLTRLLRGQRGTEPFMGNPAIAGNRVVLLDTGSPQPSVNESDVGVEWQWRVGPAAGQASDPINTALTYAPAGAGLRPFSPTFARAVRDTATGDVEITWVRRDRSFSADSWDYRFAPLSETDQTYELEILSADGLTIKRTITDLSAPTYTYGPIAQLLDFAASVTNELRVRIYQVGALGRGAPFETTMKVRRK